MSDHTIGRNMLGMLKVFNFVLYGALAIYSTFFALYLKDIGFTPVQIGLLVAGGPLIGLVANPFWAYCADRFRNNKRILIICLIGNFICMQFVFMTESYPLIYSLMLFYFMFQSPLFTQSNSLILNVIEGTNRKFGEFRAWGSLGWALIAVIAGPIIGWLGINKLWIVFDAMLLFTIFFTFLMPRGNEREQKEKFTNKGYFTVFQNKNFLIFVCLGVLISIPNSMNTTFLSIYIRGLGGTNTVVGWAAFATAILEVPVFLLLDRYLKKNSRTMLGWLTVISLLFSARWLLMSVASSAIQVIFIQLLHAITFGGYYYVGTQLTSHLVPGEYRSSGQAVYGLTWGGISGIIAGILGGWMFENLGAPVLYRICFGITICGFIGFYLLQNSYRINERYASAQSEKTM
ncbi:MFS transporter [Paenibacillus planticolens]|uniref:MFS transporter n=1 Tax=Paenibacillus planticolens TaxID=2654976 RepID=A0ABX1ZEN1_9BACL|nr:MFS transporter [Paenibacillus planticolens]NOU98554.1 MFS transporter [Paenibacillus planticolens]